MNELQLFKNREFGELGVLQIDGKEYFPATACAKALEYKEPKSAIRLHCRWGVKHTLPHPQNPDKEITMNFIPIGDLIRLITHSKMEKAQQYESWVFDEVLPSIHKAGSYGTPNITELIQQVVSQTAAEVIKQLIPAIITVVKETVKETIKGTLHEMMPQNIAPLQYAPPVDFYSSARCKLETFPPNITEQVDAMLDDMQHQQSLNFSMISRFCTINGFSISSPAVKKYFDKKFQTA